ncbi:MAG: DUF131 domain-containing protein [Candidatus Bathyarchaeia archaeon]
MAEAMFKLDAATLQSLGIIIILAGVVIFLAAFIMLLFAGFKGGKVRGGGAILVGPFPIVFGTDRESVKAVLWLSIILTVILFALFISIHFLYR